ncbi:unnamed protein product [Rhizophagus irregularis]|uniref:Uncharacterized protein n=1 Tax=Rhizophagus irregularis TaxID=588596 RepID=A0A2I1H171_9GLOM|nr:hypothetical protein RhiirA4_425379 [Rhizophagus irregularis]CAB4409325.1 unnamed protein product [Rhizophagus irregularis]
MPPHVLNDAETCRLLLAGIKKQKVDDPILYIHWDETSFNQPNGSRDNDPTHNLQTLVDSIKDAGGDDVENKHVMFAFNTGTDLARCVRQLPQWARHQANTPDVAHSVIRLNKLSSNGNYEIEPCDHAFN